MAISAVKVRVRTLRRGDFLFDAQSHDTIKAVRRSIQEVLCWPGDSFFVIYQGKSVSDDLQLTNLIKDPGNTQYKFSNVDVDGTKRDGRLDNSGHNASQCGCAGESEAAACSRPHTPCARTEETVSGTVSERALPRPNLDRKPLSDWHRFSEKLTEPYSEVAPESGWDRALANAESTADLMPLGLETKNELEPAPDSSCLSGSTNAAQNDIVLWLVLKPSESAKITVQIRTLAPAKSKPAPVQPVVHPNQQGKETQVRDVGLHSQNGDGRRCTMRMAVAMSLTLDQLKHRLFINRYTDLQPENQRLIVCGKELKANTLVGEYLCDSDVPVPTDSRAKMSRRHCSRLLILPKKNLKELVTVKVYTPFAPGDYVSFSMPQKASMNEVKEKLLENPLLRTKVPKLWYFALYHYHSRTPVQDESFLSSHINDRERTEKRILRRPRSSSTSLPVRNTHSMDAPLTSDAPFTANRSGLDVTAKSMDRGAVAPTKKSAPKGHTTAPAQALHRRHRANSCGSAVPFRNKPHVARFLFLPLMFRHIVPGNSSGGVSTCSYSFLPPEASLDIFFPAKGAGAKRLDTGTETLCCSYGKTLFTGTKTPGAGGKILGAGAKTLCTDSRSLDSSDGKSFRTRTEALSAGAKTLCSGTQTFHNSSFTGEGASSICVSCCPCLSDELSTSEARTKDCEDCSTLSSPTPSWQPQQGKSRPRNKLPESYKCWELNSTITPSARSQTQTITQWDEKGRSTNAQSAFAAHVRFGNKRKIVKRSTCDSRHLFSGLRRGFLHRLQKAHLPRLAERQGENDKGSSSSLLFLSHSTPKADEQQGEKDGESSSSLSFWSYSTAKGDEAVCETSKHTQTDSTGSQSITMGGESCDRSPVSEFSPENIHSKTRIGPNTVRVTHSGNVRANVRSPAVTPKYSNRMTLFEDSIAGLRPSDTSTRHERKVRCSHCSKKLLCMQELSARCRCGGLYCPSHSLPERHECTFDFKKGGKQKLRVEFQKISPTKVDQI